jgi:gluconate 2-dehydrogenase gamma chain
MSLTRREWIRLVGGLATLAACGDNLAQPAGVFTPEERALLATFADVVIPPDDQPGGAALGAVEFIERLITAFDEPVPPIFAGGPFRADFPSFVELDRVTDRVWRERTAAIAEQLHAGLAAARASTADPQTTFDGQPPDFKDLVIELVTEAAFASPIYGGNRDGAGWRMIHFEGDVLPQGYSKAQVEESDGADPEPLSQDVRDTIALVISVLGGRVAS